MERSALMRRVGNAGGAWVRELMLRDLEVMNGIHERFEGSPHPQFAALEAGESVTMRWWELPDELKDGLPTGDIQDLWMLTAADDLVAV